eukprot:832887-Pelagomonas_calceolata.AAC.1
MACKAQASGSAALLSPRNKCCNPRTPHNKKQRPCDLCGSNKGRVKQAGCHTACKAGGCHRVRLGQVMVQQAYHEQTKGLHQTARSPSKDEQEMCAGNEDSPHPCKKSTLAKPAASKCQSKLLDHAHHADPAARKPPFTHYYPHIC